MTHHSAIAQGGGAEHVATRDGWAEDATDARAVFRMFWRRRGTIAGSALVFAVLALLVVANQTPLYSAKATVMLNTRQSNVVNVDAVLSGLPANATQVLTEIELLQSGRLIGRVVDALRLTEDPEFNEDLRLQQDAIGVLGSSRLLERAARIISDAGSSVGSPPTLTEAERAALLRDEAVAALREKMRVAQIQYSLAISIAVETESPQKAALIANTIAEQYLVDQLEAKFEATQRATAWLTGRLDALKGQVEASEAEVEAFKASLGAGAVQGASITSQQLTQLNGELVLARAQRAEAEARYSRVADVLESRGAAAAADAISSPLIVSLRQQMAESRRRQAELATRYTERHPKMINLKAELSDTAGAIMAEVRKVVSGLKTELDVAESRETTLRDSVQALEEEAITQNRSSVALRQLEREADANRLIYESFLSRFKETEDQDGLQQADAQLISKARAPTEPSYPNRTRSIVLAGAGGLVFGLLIALLMEQLDNAYRTARQIESDLGLATLGVIPFVKGRKSRRAHLDDVVARPTWALAESMRSLRSAIFLSQADGPPRSIAVVSSLPGEGKTTVALLLAQSAARLGKSVLLVDCDLRRPTLHETFETSGEGPSLLNLLAGTAELEAVVRSDPASGIDFVPSHATAADAADLLSSRRFAELVAEFRSRYDTVVLDALPTLAVSDSVPIAKQADAVIYVVKWNDAPRDAVQAGLRTLTDRGILVNGVVLSQVDPAAQARYGGHDTAGYYGRYRQYYQD